MGSEKFVADKPHAICIPYPIQSHIKAMLKFSQLLQHKGFQLQGLSDFCFETIPDNLPPFDLNVTQDVTSLCVSLWQNFLAPFSGLISKLNSATSNIPPVTCIISDGFMPFTITTTRELGIPIVMFFTISACSLMGDIQLHTLKDKGIIPLEGITNHKKTLLKFCIIL